MERDAIYKGAEFTELPNSPKISTNASGRTAIRRFSGTYEECLANEPEVGDTYPDLPDFYVTTTEVEYGYPYASLTVNLKTQEIDPDDPDQLAGAIWYRDKTEITKPLELHPMYQQGGARQIAGTPLSIESIEAVWGLIAEWKTATAAVRTEITGTKLPALGADMTNINHLLERFSRGQTTYPIDAPVIKAVVQTLSPMPGLKGYVRDTPSHPIVPPGYKWLYTGPSVNFREDTGIYETTHEWLGSEAIDEDLYPVGGPSL